MALADATTRLGLSGTTRAPYGNFAKAPAVVVVFEELEVGLEVDRVVALEPAHIVNFSEKGAT